MIVNLILQYTFNLCWHYLKYTAIVIYGGIRLHCHSTTPYHHTTVSCHPLATPSENIYTCSTKPVKGDVSFTLSECWTWHTTFSFSFLLYTISLFSSNSSISPSMLWKKVIQQPKAALNQTKRLLLSSSCCQWLHTLICIQYRRACNQRSV